jgi:leucyl-tRNA synthetase
LASEAELERLALADSVVQAHIAGKTIKKVVVIRSRLVNVVAA